jgi:hypothetical protein
VETHGWKLLREFIEAITSTANLAPQFDCPFRFMETRPLKRGLLAHLAKQAKLSEQDRA